MKTKKGQNQSVSIFQNIVRCIAEKLPTKTKPYFLSLMLGALLTVARRRTVTTWLQAALISDDFRQAFYHMPNVGRKSNELFDEMLKEILEKLGPVLATAAIRFVTRLHGSRLIEFADAKTVKRQKNGDFHVTWKRPQRPFWMLDWMWDIVPKTMTLRLVRVRIDVPGMRTGGFFVVTNLMDAAKYPSDAIREMYRGRWQVEVDLRTIKSFMELEVYRGECPTQDGDEAAILLGEE